jgi:hypothetical protein
MNWGAGLGTEVPVAINRNRLIRPSVWFEAAPGEVAG